MPDPTDEAREKVPSEIEDAIRDAATAMEAAFSKRVGVVETYAARDAVDALRAAILSALTAREAEARSDERRRVQPLVDAALHLNRYDLCSTTKPSGAFIDAVQHFDEVCTAYEDALAASPAKAESKP